MVLKLPFNVQQEAWYPAGRVFTEFEARIDLLILIPAGPVDTMALAARWQWSADKAAALAKEVMETHSPDMYVEDDSAANRRKIAQSIIDIFNVVFDRKCQLNDYRIRAINARIKEGKKLKPPIGPDQFKAVFEFKKKEWSGTDMEKNLTIETLCAQKHFLKYLEAARLDYLKYKKVKKEESEGIIYTSVLFKA